MVSAVKPSGNGANPTLISAARPSPTSITHGSPSNVRISQPAGKRIEKPLVSSMYSAPSASAGRVVATGALVLADAVGAVVGTAGVDMPGVDIAGVDIVGVAVADVTGVAAVGFFAPPATLLAVGAAATGRAAGFSAAAAFAEALA